MTKIPEELARYFKGAGRLFGHDWLKLATLAWGESTLNPTGPDSSAGAKGLFQFMEPAWQRFGRGPWSNAYDPLEATIAAARYLSYIRGFLAHTGRLDPVWEFVAYNCGETGAKNYEDWLDVPEQTRRWIAKMLRQWAEWLDGDVV